MFNFLVVVLSVIVNWVLTYAITSLILGFFYKKGTILLGSISLTPEIISTLILVLVVAIGLTPSADGLFRVMSKIRRPIRLESERVQPLWNEVCRKSNLDPSKFSIYICDEQFPNAYALGLGTVAISRGLLQTSTDREIMALMAHEVGHHKHGDCIVTRIYFVVSFIGQVALLIYKILTTLFMGAARFPLLNIVCLPIALLFRVQVWMIELLLILPLMLAKFLGSRFQEYAADRYAAEMGYGSDLASFLHKIIDLEGSPTGLWGFLYRTHPTPGARIRRLEDMNVA